MHNILSVNPFFLVPPRMFFIHQEHQVSMVGKSVPGPPSAPTLHFQPCLHMPQQTASGLLLTYLSETWSVELLTGVTLGSSAVLHP